MTKLLWYPFSDFDLLQVLVLHSSLAVIVPLTAFGTCKKTVKYKGKIPRQLQSKEEDQRVFGMLFVGYCSF